MDFLSKIFNYIKVKLTGESSAPQKTQVGTSVKEPILHYKKEKPQEGEIPMMRELSDEEIQTNNDRAKYIATRKNPKYEVKNGDNIEKIANKFGIETRSLLVANNLTEKTARKIRVGQVLKVPDTRSIKGVKNLAQVADAMGVSETFIKDLKRLEDDKHLSDNEFHTTPYKDKAGVLTIGIGHVVKRGEPKKLTNAQVCELCAKDLLKAESNLVAVLGGQKVYDRIPSNIKAAVLDLTFNKGIVKDESFDRLVYCLKNQKWEAAINQLTFNKSTKTKKEMSGLSKRRLYDISVATRHFGKNIPQTNKNTAQNVYNRGVQLLREECKAKGLNFADQIVGYNKDVKAYFGNRIPLKFITK